MGLLLWLLRFLNQLLLLGFDDLLDLRLLGPAAIQHDAELLPLVGLVPVVLVAVDLVPLVLLLDAAAVFEAEGASREVPQEDDPGVLLVAVLVTLALDVGSGSPGSPRPTTRGRCT